MSALREYRLNVLFETLEKTASRAGLTKSYLSNVENYSRFNPRATPKLAKAYRLSIDEFKRLVGAGTVGVQDRGNQDAGQHAVRNAG